MKQPSKAQQIIIVLWLSFVMAGIATGAFFSAIDPDALRPCLVFPEVSRMGAYSIGFLLFWLLTAATGLLVIYFQKEVYPSQSQ